jgi:hypothetical protein
MIDTLMDPVYSTIYRIDACFDYIYIDSNIHDYIQYPRYPRL